MFIAYVIVSIIFALILIASAWGKLTRDERIVTGIAALGIRLKWFPYFAACLLLGAVGLLAGIAFAPLGIAAAIGLVLYFIGAVVAHLRVRDKAVVPPLVLLAFAIAVLLMRIGSLQPGSTL